MSRRIAPLSRLAVTRPPGIRDSVWTYATLRAAERCTKCRRPSADARCSRCADRLAVRRFANGQPRRPRIVRGRLPAAIADTTPFDIAADRREELIALSEISALHHARHSLCA